MEKKANKRIYYVVVIASIVAVGGLGSLFTELGMEWYKTLEKPGEWLPDVVIPIAWTVIYLTFGVTLVFFRNKLDLVKRDYVLLILNGVFNVLWCLVYFTLGEILLGEVVIIMNFVLSVLLITSLYDRNKTVACILGMYPTWLAIATALNTAIWILN